MSRDRGKRGRPHADDALWEAVKKTIEPLRKPSSKSPAESEEGEAAIAIRPGLRGD